MIDIEDTNQEVSSLVSKIKIMSFIPSLQDHLGRLFVWTSL